MVLLLLSIHKILQKERRESGRESERKRGRGREGVSVSGKREGGRERFMVFI